jgi:hypothetical protein
MAGNGLEILESAMGTGKDSPLAAAERADGTNLGDLSRRIRAK